MLELECPHCNHMNYWTEILHQETIECEACKKDIYHGLSIYNGDEKE